jgi:hypothetical protein
MMEDRKLKEERRNLHLKKINNDKGPEVCIVKEKK